MNGESKGLPRTDHDTIKGNHQAARPELVEGDERRIPKQSPDAGQAIEGETFFEVAFS
jgi:hypothetical protein